MNSVDTGWINDENPLPKAAMIAEKMNFQVCAHYGPIMLLSIFFLF